MTLHNAETDNEHFADNAPENGFFKAIEELNGLIHDTVINRRRIIELIRILEVAQDRILKTDPQSEDLISIANTLTQDKLAEVMLEGEE